MILNLHDPHTKVFAIISQDSYRSNQNDLINLYHLSDTFNTTCSCSVGSPLEGNLYVTRFSDF